MSTSEPSPRTSSSKRFGIGSLFVLLDQDYLTEFLGNRNPVAAFDLSGMSGGPAFLIGELAYPVVALLKALRVVFISRRYRTCMALATLV